MSLRRASSLFMTPSNNKLSLSSQATRSLSTQGNVALEKLRGALEEYRLRHYTQEVPSRFKKDVMKAAKHDASSKEVTMDGMQRVIVNIDMQHKVSLEEIDKLFLEIGGDGRAVAAEKMIKLI